MPTHLELALISKEVYYDKGGFLHAWEVVDFIKEEQLGLVLAVYKNKENDTVIAFRGTDTGNIDRFIKNMLTNLDIVLGKVPNTVERAQKIVQEIREKRSPFVRLKDWFQGAKLNQLYLTGHSLGGTLASLVGFNLFKQFQKKYFVVTFDNPGIAHHIDANDLKNFKDHFNQYFMTYLADPSPLNTIHEYIGVVNHVRIKPHSSTIYDTCTYNIYYAIDCVINDFLRLLLLLSLAIFLYSNIYEENTTTRNLSQLTHDMSNYLYKSGYIYNLDRRDHNSSIFYLLLCIAATILGKAINKIYALVARQHPIDVIIGECKKGKGSPEHCTEIESWPNMKQYYKSHMHHYLKWLYQPTTHPCLLKLTKSDELHRAMVESMEGYQVKRLTK